MIEIVSKAEFAAIAGVSRPTVSQWLREGKIAGDAIVGVGRHARIRVAAALQQLNRNLDPVQHLGANGRARVDGDGGAEPDTVEQEIKRLRAQQLALSNAALEAAAAARSGRYTLADDARQEIGRAVAQVLAVVDSALAGMANAVVAAKPTTPREALRVLRASSATMKALIEDDQLALVGGQNV